jgi:hydroxymethylpyrimidine pyrophosphatase-like HAD family hydrolase
MLLLATDLDGTLLGGNLEEKHELYSYLRANPTIRLVFVTGRGLETVKPLLLDPTIPNPCYIICDVGATVVDGRTLEPIEPIHSEIEDRWPGSTKVSNYLQDIPGLREQEVPMMRRCSYHLDGDLDFEMLEKRAAELGCDILVSAGKFIDILPPGVNKGFTLQKLIEMMQVPEESILVAGDTLNDLSLFQTGYKGVVVGGAEVELKEATAGHDMVYQADRLGCGGILDALKYYYSSFDTIQN